MATSLRTLRFPDPELSAPPAAATSPFRPLAELAPGETARVERVDATRPIGRRLLDLGFTPGTRVRMVRRAPLGDPVTYELRGMRLCLRRTEALQVEIARPAEPARRPSPKR